MKALPFNIPKTDKNFLMYQEDEAFKLFDRFHRHTEIQLSYISEGSGTLIVGNTINDFNKGDIVLLGSNVPHVFKNDVSDKKAKMLTLFFNYNESTKNPLELEDLKSLKVILDKSNKGLLFSNCESRAKQIFENLYLKSSIDKFIDFLALLSQLVNCKAINLSDLNQTKPYTNIQVKRMKKVMDFSLMNFQSEITLDKISEVANLTKHSFCKYFKNHTNKSYTEFLNELRINHAAKLLVFSKDLNVVEVAEHSGYNNLSHFNRQFKKYKSMSPSQYRSNYIE